MYGRIVAYRGQATAEAMRDLRDGDAFSGIELIRLQDIQR